MRHFADEAIAWLARAALAPGGTADWVVAGVSWALAGVLAINVFGLAIRNPNETLFSSLIVLAVSGLVGLAAATGAGLASGAPSWLPPAAGAVAGLSAGMLLMVGIQRVGWAGGAASIAVAVAAAAVLHLAARTATDGLRSGRSQFERVESRTDDINRALE